MYNNVVLSPNCCIQIHPLPRLSDNVVCWTLIMGDFGNAAISIHLFTRWHHPWVLEDIEIIQNNIVKLQKYSKVE